MNLQRINLILWGCYLTLSPVWTQEESTSIKPDHQLLWQISGNGLKKNSYLFGSYHSNDPRVFRLSDSTFSAINRVDGIVLEADIYELFTQYDMRIGRAKLKFDSEGRPYTSDRRASKTRYGDEDGRPQFLDLYFQQLAQNMGKGFYVLETIEEQMEAFEALFERSRTQMSLQQLKVIQDNLMQSYLDGDIDRLLTLIQKQMGTGAAYERIIVKRNEHMAVGIDSLCRKRSLFVAVGAGHLAGDKGLIQLLRSRGFRVNQVVASFSPERTEAEKKLRLFSRHTYQDSTYGFSAVLGGIPVRDSSVLTYRLIYQEMGQGNTYVIELEKVYERNFSEYAEDLIDPPKNGSVEEILHQQKIPAYEGIGFEYGVGLCWKRVFEYQGNLVKLMCYGGNKFMNSNRPTNFFNQVIFR
ncbi:MAG: TraB/GumN family protein [Bacteroidetes bacterium]|nr:MAG: TraB/GumN family protein [Bacteroidota bacterium]